MNWCIGVSAAVGALVPLSVRLYGALVEKFPGARVWIAEDLPLEAFVPLIWPSQILLYADPASENIHLLIVAWSLNVGLYAAMGWLICVGWKRNKILFGVPIVFFVGWVLFLATW